MRDHFKNIESDNRSDKKTKDKADYGGELLKDEEVDLNANAYKDDNI